MIGSLDTPLMQHYRATSLTTLRIIWFQSWMSLCPPDMSHHWMTFLAYALLLQAMNRLMFCNFSVFKLRWPCLRFISNSQKWIYNSKYKYHRYCRDSVEKASTNDFIDWCRWSTLWAKKVVTLLREYQRSFVHGSHVWIRPKVKRRRRC